MRLIPDSAYGVVARSRVRNAMSSRDSIDGIEDEPYQGLYHAMQPKVLDGAPGHLPDRFDLAEILKSTREARGWTLDEVSEITRVRRAYLEALEQAAYDVLPPRAFALGYVKAYAKALDLDEETLADMFKREVSEPHTRLHAPSGASLEDVKPNYRLYITAGVCLVVAIVAWNILQYKPLLLAARNRADAFDSLPWSKGAVPLIRDGVVLLTKPAPAPRDQDIPAPYVTPGLESQFASLAATDASNDDGGPVPVQDVLPSHAFNPQGAVYGAQPENSSVTIQATRSVTLTLRDNGGIVYFAHQFGPGEAFRLSQTDQQNLIVDISDPKAFDIYYNGEYAGPMAATQTQVGQLNARAAQLANALDATQASQHQVASVFEVPPAPEAPTVIKKSDQPIPYMQPKPEPAAAPKPVTPRPTAPASASASSSAPASSVATPPAAAPSPAVPEPATPAPQ